LKWCAFYKNFGVTQPLIVFFWHLSTHSIKS